MRRRCTARDRVGVMGMTIAGAMTAMKAAGVGHNTPDPEGAAGQ